jgi:hypothetical protein
MNGINNVPSHEYGQPKSLQKRHCLSVRFGPAVIHEVFRGPVQALRIDE